MNTTEFIPQGPIGITEGPIEKTFDTFRDYRAALENDWGESSAQLNRIGFLSAAAGYFGIKAAGKLQVPPLVVSVAAMETANATQNAVAAGVGAAIVGTGWNLLAGASVQRTVDASPSLYETSAKRFPKISQFQADQLPGLTAYTAEGKLAEQQKNVAGRACTRIRRGVVATKKTMSYPAMAAMQGQTTAEIRQLNRNASVESGIFRATVVAGFIVYPYLKIQENNPDIAKQVEDMSTSPVTWFIAGTGLSTLFGLYELAKNRWSRRRAQQ